MHWYKHCGLQPEENSAVDNCSGPLSLPSYADAAKQIEGDNKERSDDSSSDDDLSTAVVPKEPISTAVVSKEHISSHPDRESAHL